MGIDLDDFILCADDFGMNHQISAGILALVEAHRIHAVSVMTESPVLPSYAAALRPHPVQIGLHFNLTQCFSPDGGKKPYALRRLLYAPILLPTTRLDLAQRLDAQLTQFEDHFGRMPDFVDGHEHVHLLPAVRNIFLGALARRYAGGTERPWIRQVQSDIRNTDRPFKSAILNGLNLGFRHACSQHGFETNRRFAGIYSLTPAGDYPQQMTRWLKNIRPGLLMMCHPAKGHDPTDSIAAAREAEFDALMDPQFAALLATAKGHRE